MKILIAEDDRSVRLLLHKILGTEPSFEIRETADGSACWEALQSDPLPDVCLLDLEMPGMTGLQVLEKMRSEDRLRDVPALIITSHSDAHSKASAAALGAHAFVVKPFKAKAVISLVKEAAQSSGKVFHPLGFEDRETVLAREGLDLAGYFKAMTYFVEVLAARFGTIERLLIEENWAALANALKPVREAAQRVGAQLFLEYLDLMERLGAHSSQSEIDLAKRRFRMMRVEHRELKDALEGYLQVVLESDSKRKIVTEPDMTDWAGESIRLSAEIEEQLFDQEGGFSLGNESILLKAFRGDETIAVARFAVKGGRAMISSLFESAGARDIDLSQLMPTVADPSPRG